MHARAWTHKHVKKHAFSSLAKPSQSLAHIHSHDPWPALEDRISPNRNQASAWMRLPKPYHLVFCTSPKATPPYTSCMYCGSAKRPTASSAHTPTAPCIAHALTGSSTRIRFRQKDSAKWKTIAATACQEPKRPGAL